MTNFKSNGFSLIEVLVTIIILLVGLLGLAGLQGRAFNAQLEAYQRSQALILLKDMANRIEANRKNAAAYITASPADGGAGVNVTTVTCPGGTVAEQDLCNWHNALQGAAEGGTTGAMIGARGCVFVENAYIPGSGSPGVYHVVIAWQGMNSTLAPDTTQTFSPGKCGLGQYKNRDGTANEALHRAISIPVTVADLL